MDNKIMMAAIAIALILVGGFLYTSSSGATVKAQGISKIEASPDEVSVNLMIQTRGNTSKEAKDLHDKIMDEVIIQLLRTGLEMKDIQMINFNLYPEYNWENGNRDIIGFTASQNIVVVTNDFNKVTDIVDAGINGGAFVSYINFELSDNKLSDLKVQALEEAGIDAKKKAEAIASGPGKKLGSLVSIQSQEFNYGPYRYFEASVVDGSTSVVKEAASNLAPRDIEVTASVSVEYKLRAF